MTRSLEGRHFGVRAEECLSVIGPLNSRLPRGSVLEPLLFLAYASDVIDGLQNLYFIPMNGNKLLGTAKTKGIQTKLTSGS